MTSDSLTIQAYSSHSNSRYGTGHYKGGLVMPDENTELGWVEEWGDQPSLELILSTWLTTDKASEVMEITASQITRLCTNRLIPSMKIGRQWYIQPEAADAHKRWSHRKDE